MYVYVYISSQPHSNTQEESQYIVDKLKTNKQYLSINKRYYHLYRNMMDAMSSQPPPNTQEASQYIVDKLKTDYNNYGVSEDDLRFVVVDELNIFDSLGSLAA